jgi:arginase family enzyme
MCWDMSTPSFRLQTPSTLTQGMRLGRALTQGPATPTKENIVQHGISSVKHALSPIAERVGKALGTSWVTYLGTDPIREVRSLVSGRV